MARAQTVTSPIWINAGFYTIHFARNHALRDPNPGMGLEYSLNDDLRLTAGRFLNSDSAYLNYVGAYYQPWRQGSLKLGVAAGLFDGYPRALGGGGVPALLPVWIGFAQSMAIAVTEDARWDARHNARSALASQNGWNCVLLAIVVLLVGTTICLTSIILSAQYYYEAEQEAAQSAPAAILPNTPSTK